MSALAGICEIVCRLVGPCVATKRYLNTMTWPPMVVWSPMSRRKFGIQGGPFEEKNEEAESAM
ncbi:hypothetical protein BDR22DRAFT_835642 [Usnea florida]